MAGYYTRFLAKVKRFFFDNSAIIIGCCVTAKPARAYEKLFFKKIFNPIRYTHHASRTTLRELLDLRIWLCTMITEGKKPDRESMNTKRTNRKLIATEFTEATEDKKGLNMGPRWVPSRFQSGFGREKTQGVFFFVCHPFLRKG